MISNDSLLLSCDTVFGNFVHRCIKSSLGIKLGSAAGPKSLLILFCAGDIDSE